MTKLTWKPFAGTPNFDSDCGAYVALYAGTGPRGFASYRVFRTSLPLALRKAQNALSVGGLPGFAYWERQELDAAGGR